MTFVLDVSESLFQMSYGNSCPLCPVTYCSLLKMLSLLKGPVPIVIRLLGTQTYITHTNCIT